MSDHEHPDMTAVLHLRDGGVMTHRLMTHAPDEIFTRTHLGPDEFAAKMFRLRAFHYGEPPHEWHYDEVDP